MGFTVDVGHCFMARENPAEAAAHLLMAGRLFGAHFNDTYGVDDDDLIAGSVHVMHLLELLLYLDDMGYEDWYGLDYFPYREDAVRAAELSIDNIETTEDRTDHGLGEATRSAGTGDRDQRAAVRARHAVQALREWRGARTAAFFSEECPTRRRLLHLGDLLRECVPQGGEPMNVAMPDEVLASLSSRKLVAVVRAPSKDSAVAVADALAAGGVTAIEVTFSTPGAAAIRELSGRPDLVIGAGTVTALRAGRGCPLGRRMFPREPAYGF